MGTLFVGKDKSLVEEKPKEEMSPRDSYLLKAILYLLLYAGKGKLPEGVSGLDDIFFRGLPSPQVSPKERVNAG